VKKSAATDGELGELLQEFINRVSHLRGHTLAVLTEASVTLQQVLLLRRLQHMGESTLSDLAARMRMSPPAVSQMIDRLFALELLTRVEADEDRRRKKVSVTKKGAALLERVRRARAAEYTAGVSGLSAAVRAELLGVMRRALQELPHEADAVATTAADEKTKAS
jgi:MarR family transcriptional regulator, organic hydroperoxide resistance regulator